MQILPAKGGKTVTIKLAEIKEDLVLGSMLETWLLVMSYTIGYRVLKDGSSVKILTIKQAAEILLAIETTLDRCWPEPLREGMLRWNGGELDLEDFKKRCPCSWSAEVMTAELKGLTGERTRPQKAPERPGPLLPGLERGEIDRIPF